jgi:hypothetical protein
MLLRFSQAILLAGAVLIFASFMMDHPPIYPGGKVEYGSQAIAIAKEECRDMATNIGYFQWHAWLTDQQWNAGFIRRSGHCVVVIDPRTGKIMQIYAGAV